MRLICKENWVMKSSKQFLLSLATAAAALFILGCGGGGGGSSTSASPVTTYGTSCGNNMLMSQYGCLPQCGPQSVVYQGQCVPIAAYGQNAYGQNGQYMPGYNNAVGYGSNMCQGSCPAGLISVGNGWACLPQSNGCGPCYGYMAGYCYQGDGARYYYGY